MMRRRYGMAVVWACLMTAGPVHAGDHDRHHLERHFSPLNVGYSPNAFKVPYLGLDGAFTIVQNLSVTYYTHNSLYAVHKHVEISHYHMIGSSMDPLPT
jgi:hypothetical protein